jgi:hypothetical protein
VKPLHPTNLRRPRIFRKQAAVLVAAALVLVLAAPTAHADGGTFSVSVPGSVTVGMATTVSVTGTASQAEALYVYVTDVDASCPAMPSDVFDEGTAESPGDATLADGVPVGQGSVTETHSYTSSQAAGFLVCGYLDTNENDIPDADSSAPLIVSNPTLTPPVTAPTATPPVTTPPRSAVKPKTESAPTVSGALVVGHTLTASRGRWEGTRPISYAYKWQRCIPKCSAIDGATRSSYRIPARDTGAQFQVIVTASDAAGSTQSTSLTTYRALDAICGREPCLPDRPGGGAFYKTPLILLTSRGMQFVAGSHLPSGRSPFGANKLDWVTWNSTRALASGYFWKDSCVPSCRSGTYELFPAVVIATRPRNNVFTRLSVVYATNNGYVSLTAPITRSGAFTVRIQHEPAEACSGSYYTGGRSAPGESGFFRYVRATGVSCEQAQQVTLGFIRDVGHNPHAFDDEVVDVSGFACVAAPQIAADEVDVSCTSGPERVAFHVGS